MVLTFDLALRLAMNNRHYDQDVGANTQCSPSSPRPKTKHDAPDLPRVSPLAGLERSTRSALRPALVEGGSEVDGGDLARG
jgi:hypothetical protein